MTGTLGEIFIRYFIRYFVPGAVFYFSSVFLPLQIFFDAATKPVNLTSGDVAIMGSIIFGYLLDSIGAYAWHSQRIAYRREKIRLAVELEKVDRSIVALENSKVPDPDFLSISLWLKDQELYDRITVERAEWVAILESAFSLCISACIITLGVFFKAIVLRQFEYLWFLVLVFFMILVSNLASQKGIQRMKIHDARLIEAMKQNVESSRQVIRHDDSSSTG